MDSYRGLHFRHEMRNLRSMKSPKKGSPDIKGPPIRYPKPGPMGGRLIREMIAFLRESGVHLPITSHILCAVSGGPDSVALVHLLSKYGRRVGDSKRIRILHVNHAWRGKASDRDEKFVCDLARQLGVRFTAMRLKPPKRNGQSWEDEARRARKEIFRKQAVKHHGGVIFTAHQADDLAETLLWRLFTGSAATHGGGIIVQDGPEIRPFLRIRKSDLMEYLKEEGQGFRTDSTNRGGRFLRARMRARILPSIEREFPKAIEHLVRAGLKAQNAGLGNDVPIEAQSSEPLAHSSEPLAQRSLFGAAGLRLRRSHWEALSEKAKEEPQWTGEIHLPDGWILRAERQSGGLNPPKLPSNPEKSAQSGSRRWILEKRPSRSRSRRSRSGLAANHSKFQGK